MAFAKSIIRCVVGANMMYFSSVPWSKFETEGITDWVNDDLNYILVEDKTGKPIVWCDLLNSIIWCPRI